MFLLVLICQASYGQNAEGFSNLAKKELSLGNYPKALQYLNGLLEIDRFNAKGYFLRGYTKYQLDDFIGAEKDFNASIELDKKNHEAFLYRGVCRSQINKFREAFEDYNTAAKLNDKDWQIYANRSLTNLQLDRFVDVISDCNKVIKLKKQNSQTYLIRGEAKSGLELYWGAIDDFNRAIKIDSASAKPILRRGIARVELELFELAIADFNRALEMDSKSVLPIFYRGVAYSQMGKTQLALNDFNEVLQLYPNNEVVLFNRAMLFADMGKSSEALVDYNRVTQLNPTNILARFNRGILYSNENRNNQALDDFNSAINLFPEFLDAHEVRLKLLQRMGDRKAFLQAEQELRHLKLLLASSPEEVKEEQKVRLLKRTKLKGEFEETTVAAGKVQHKEVDVRLLPFYNISPSPEKDKNISVYDGFGRPFYDMGVITFTTSKTLIEEGNAQLVVKELATLKNSSTTELIRSIPFYIYAKQFEQAISLLDDCISSDTLQAACYFARASVRQVQLERLIDKHLAMVGSLDVIDSLYEQKRAFLLAQAEQDYRKVIMLDKNMSFAHFNLAHILALAEHYNEAETHFGLAASARGNFIEANYNRGLIRLILGKTQKGCEDLSLVGELGMTEAYNIILRYCE